MKHALKLHKHGNKSSKETEDVSETLWYKDFINSNEGLGSQSVSAAASSSSSTSYNYVVGRKDGGSKKPNKEELSSVLKENKLALAVFNWITSVFHPKDKNFTYFRYYVCDTEKEHTVEWDTPHVMKILCVCSARRNKKTKRK
jgi:hypothetical protein